MGRPQGKGDDRGRASWAASPSLLPSVSRATPTNASGSPAGARNAGAATAGAATAAAVGTAAVGAVGAAPSRPSLPLVAQAVGTQATRAPAAATTNRARMWSMPMRLPTSGPTAKPASWPA